MRLLRYLTLFTLILSAVSVCAAPPKKITNRKNVAAELFGATAKIIHKDGSSEKVTSILQGSYVDNNAVALKGIPATIEIEFAQPEQINLIRIYPGNLKYAPYPSGEAGIKSYKIERYNNGYYHPLVEAKNQPSHAQSGAAGGEEYCFEHSFKPIKAEKIRITITESGHTGKSASRKDIIPMAERSSLVRAVEVYSSKRSNEQAVWLRDVLIGDFNLRVYRDQKIAKLFFDAKLGSLPVALTIVEEKSQKTVYSKDVTIKNGKQTIDIPLADIADGRYIVSIEAKDKKSPFKGAVKRMLRIDRLGEVELPQGVINVAGMRVFPVDNFHFEKLQNVRNTIVQAESIQTSKRMGWGDGRQDGRVGRFFTVDSQGNYISQFAELDSKKGRKYFYAYSKDLKNWECSENPPAEVPPVLPSAYAKQPDSANQNNRIKTPFKDADIRFYDKEKDGSFELNEVRIQWFPPFIGDVDSKGGIVKKWSTYPVIERNGEWLLLTKEPLYVERFDYEGDALENDVDCNDNFGNAYLSDDGKTLFVGKGGRLRTFAPYTIEYDNIPEAYRIMRVYYTHDGINWDYKYFCPPDEKDVKGMQHYGYAVHRIDKNFYIGFISAYPCYDQQIYPEICYSRDGLNWIRLEDRTPFIANTDIDTWLFGMIFIEPINAVEHNGSYYLPLGVCWQRPHFYPAKNAGAEALRRSFESRNLTKEWKYFKDFGSWDKLAKSVEKAELKNDICGIAKFRKDGFIAVKAKKNAELVSRTFTADNCKLILNAKGSMKLTLLDENNQEISGFTASFSGDETNKVITWANGSEVLPNGNFKVKITPELNSEIYTLNFVK
ncbi:MAG: hypothetical protein IKD09_03230 [Lentisphaeria bacterium]|nr:hypothetical protein [Lentisphaeria bacterium]